MTTLHTQVLRNGKVWKELTETLGADVLPYQAPFHIDLCYDDQGIPFDCVFLHTMGERKVECTVVWTPDYARITWIDNEVYDYLVPRWADGSLLKDYFIAHPLGAIERFIGRVIDPHPSWQPSPYIEFSDGEVIGIDRWTGDYCVRVPEAEGRWALVDKEQLPRPILQVSSTAGYMPFEDLP